MQGRDFRAAPGERVYAIGDVHGCWPLLREMFKQIRADNAQRPEAVTRIIMLGDIVDRGAESQGVLINVMRYTRASDRFLVLMGNHEQLMWSALSGDLEALKGWLAVGGLSTLRSFGVSETVLGSGASRRLLEESRRKIGASTTLWLERLPLTATSGGLVFVHAGVRPGTPLAAQTIEDLLWIRAPFLDDTEDRPFLVIHGHNIVEDGPDVRPNRIGLDTGAYRTGRLTAMGFEADERWSLSVMADQA